MSTHYEQFSQDSLITCSLSQPLQEAWSILQDSNKSKDETGSALSALLRQLGISEADELEYAEASDVARIAGSLIHCLINLYSSSLFDSSLLTHQSC